MCTMYNCLNFSLQCLMTKHSDMEADDTGVLENYKNDSVEKGSRNGSIAKIEVKNIDKREFRAKSARELVQNQDRLVNMLQSMKSELCKMDREAIRIKEDIVRSNQYFNVVVKKKMPHHLPYLPEGYNLPYSIPKVIYPKHKPFDRYLNKKLLNQLSTFRPTFLDKNDSRRSSVSSQYSSIFDGDYQHGISNVRSSRRSSIDSRRSNSSANGDFSGTESEMELIQNISSSDISRNSSCSYEDNGSSAESTCSAEYPEDFNPQLLTKRKSSYFYTMRVETPSHSQSDEVEL